MVKVSRIRSSLLLILGTLGSLASLSAFLATIVFYNSLQQTITRVFDQSQNGVELVEERYSSLLTPLALAKSNCDNLVNALQLWESNQEAPEGEFQSRLTEKAAALKTSIQRVNHWLKIAQSSLELVEQGLSLGRSAGLISADLSVRELADELSRIQDSLSNSEDSASRIQKEIEFEGTANISERISRASTAVAKLIPRLENAEQRIQHVRPAFRSIQDRIQEYKRESRSWMFSAFATVCLTLIWILVGQIALIVLGWRTRRSAA